MATTYLNGGSTSSYTGFQFSDATTLLSTIQSTLVSAGWTSTSYTAGTSLMIEGSSITGSFPCYAYFTISGTSPNLTLTMQGSLDGGTTNVSPSAVHTLTFTVGTTNRLWLTCDQESLCICIYDAFGNCRGHHLGFLQRVDVTDQYAWMIGSLHTLGYQYAYSAKSKYNGTQWHQLSADYYNYTGLNNNGCSPLTTFDALARIYYANGSGANDTNPYNAGYYIENGRINYDGSIYIDPYMYLEGRGSAGVYGNTAGGTTLYFRGLVKNAFCGLATVQAANQAVDSISGNIILSVGGAYWQGMRIN